MKIKTFSKSEIKELNASMPVELSKKDTVQRIDDKYIKVNGNVMFFFFEGKTIPTIKTLLSNNFLQKVTVDMGAIKFVISGADIMRPGIVAVEEFEKDAIVAIIDENNKKPIAIGKALFSSEDLMKEEKGKSVRNIHYVGDEIWNF